MNNSPSVAFKKLLAIATLSTTLLYASCGGKLQRNQNNSNRNTDTIEKTRPEEKGELPELDLSEITPEVREFYLSLKFSKDGRFQLDKQTRANLTQISLDLHNIAKRADVFDLIILGAAAEEYTAAVLTDWAAKGTLARKLRNPSLTSEQLFEEAEKDKESLINSKQIDSINEEAVRLSKKKIEHVKGAQMSPLHLLIHPPRQTPKRTPEEKIPNITASSSHNPRKHPADSHTARIIQTKFPNPRTFRG